jgi:CRISPR/Cas system Type II protein with McrA/HNH and RuvC-like nuclease domain
MEAKLRRSRHYTQYNVAWNELEALYNKQNGRCALSGVPITIGENASLDHIIPRAKGGTNTIDNYQWVHSDVNMMKNAFPVKRFIEWCSLIARNHQK